jgi:hypothetical protein
MGTFSRDRWRPVMSGIKTMPRKGKPRPKAPWIERLLSFFKPGTGKSYCKTAKAEPDKPVRRIHSNGKDPWEGFFPRDWMMDEKLSMCSVATQGVWIRMLCVMWINECYELIGTTDQIALKIGRRDEEVKSAVIELHETDAADVLDWPSKIKQTQANLVSSIEANGKQIIRSRRLYKKHSLRKIRAEAGRKGGSKTQANPQANVKQPSISTSTSNSTSAGPGNQGRVGTAPASPDNGLVPAQVGSDLEEDYQPF